MYFTLPDLINGVRCGIFFFQCISIIIGQIAGSNAGLRSAKPLKRLLQRCPATYGIAMAKQKERIFSICRL